MPLVLLSNSFGGTFISYQISIYHSPVFYLIQNPIPEILNQTPTYTVLIEQFSGFYNIEQSGVTITLVLFTKKLSSDIVTNKNNYYFTRNCENPH